MESMMKEYDFGLHFEKHGKARFDLELTLFWLFSQKLPGPCKGLGGILVLIAETGHHQ